MLLMLGLEHFTDYVVNVGIRTFYSILYDRLVTVKAAPHE